jgi:predicted nucleotidyltransferase
LIKKIQTRIAGWGEHEWKTAAVLSKSIRTRDEPLKPVLFGFKGSVMNVDVYQILTELKHELARIYGERFKGLYLFGSYARNEVDDESDVDLLIVLDRVDDYSEEIRRTSELISNASLKYGVTLSRYFAPEANWQEDTPLFYLNVREEAIPA